MFDVSLGLVLWQVLAAMLAAAGLYGALTRSWQLAAVAALLLANWIILTAIPDLPHDKPNWIAAALIDLPTGMLVLLVAWKRLAGLLIVFLYLCEVASHLSFGICDVLTVADEFFVRLTYWKLTHWGAWLQAWSLLMWMTKDAYRWCRSADHWYILRRNDRRFWTALNAIYQDEGAAV